MISSRFIFGCKSGALKIIAFDEKTKDFNKAIYNKKIHNGLIVEMRIYNNYLITAGLEGAIQTFYLKDDKEPEAVSKWTPEVPQSNN